MKILGTSGNSTSDMRRKELWYLLSLGYLPEAE